MSFIHDDFLLHTPMAERLYHEVAKDLPIIDYHCHLPPLDLADNREKNVAGFALFIDVVQKIRILRLNAVFTMPTTTLYFHKLSAYNRLDDDVINGLHHLLGQFIKREKQATTIGQ